MACAWVTAAIGEHAAPPSALAAAVGHSGWRAVQRLAVTGVASPYTTSIGRLFDAVAALCGLRLEVNYEGQAAIELEALCDPAEADIYPLPFAGREPVVMDARPTIRAVLSDLSRSVSPARIAARFHNTIVSATVSACLELAASRDLEEVVLSGGSFQNRRLLEGVSRGLRAAGLRVLIPQLLPPNDGGVSFGQAAVAAARWPIGDRPPVTLTAPTAR
jgi:hydrogenase maturation protein HypF